jgi:hypothetical protein
MPVVSAAVGGECTRRAAQADHRAIVSRPIHETLVAGGHGVAGQHANKFRGVAANHGQRFQILGGNHVAALAGIVAAALKESIAASTVTDELANPHSF